MKKIILLLAVINGIAYAQTLNRQMVLDSVWESPKINISYPDKALIIVHSQVQNLLFDEPNKNLKIEAVGSGMWNIYLSPGTVRLKIDANGFLRLELEPMNFQRNKTYEMKISALGFTSLTRADENLFELTFELDQAEVYSSFGNLTPILSKSKYVSFKVPKGEYTFRFQKVGYVDEVRTISVSGNQQITIALQPGTGKVSTLKMPGVIALQSVPPGAEIVVNGQTIGTTPFQFDLVAGNYQLELRKPLYYPDASVFDLKENETKELTRPLKPRFGYLTVSCDQQGASVFLDEKPIGTTPIAQRSIESGKHTLRVELLMFHDFTEVFTMKDSETKAADVLLKPAFGSLEIASAPEAGADVYLDNNKVGVTPFANPRVASGKYVLRVSKNLFKDVEEEVIVVDGFPMKRTVILGKNFGELTISAPDQAIVVNDRNVGTGSYTARLAPGKYSVRSERGEKYIPDSRDVFLAIGEPTTITLNARPRLGGITVVVEPYEARNSELYLNGEPKGKAPGSFPLIIGTHSIMARGANFLDATQSVDVREGEQRKVTFTLTTYEGSRQSRKDAWGRSKWISAAITVLASAGAYYCQSEADNSYADYKLASTPETVKTTHDKTTQFNLYTGIALGTAATGGVFALVSWIWQASI